VGLVGRAFSQLNIGPWQVNDFELLKVPRTPGCTIEADEGLYVFAYTITITNTGYMK